MHSTGAQRLLLIVSLLLPVSAVLMLQPVVTMLVPMVVLVVAECMLLIAWRHLRRSQCEAQQRIRELEHALIGQPVIDTASGAALPHWFAQVLETECRRAVREFTPLTVMQVEVRAGDEQKQTEACNRLARLLTDKVSRPGDLLGLTSTGSLQLLLPSTNEHSARLADRIVEQASHLLADEAAQVRVAACTLQPLADLTADKVRQHLLPLVEQVCQDGPGSVAYFAETTGSELPSPTYTV